MNCYFYKHLETGTDFPPVLHFVMKDKWKLRWIKYRRIFYLHGLNLVPAWISNHIRYKMWNAIIYSFANLSGADVEVWEWVSNSPQLLVGHMITYPYLGFSQSVRVKVFPGNVLLLSRPGIVIATTHRFTIMRSLHNSALISDLYIIRNFRRSAPFLSTGRLSESGLNIIMTSFLLSVSMAQWAFKSWRGFWISKGLLIFRDN